MSTEQPVWLLFAILLITLTVCTIARAGKEPCYPVPEDAARAYRAWGRRQEPKLEYQYCDRKCEEGKRLCTFHDPRKRPVPAVCNGRDVQPPCILAK